MSWHSKAGEAVARDVAGVVNEDQRIGVARIADNEGADVGGGVLLERLALADEDLAVRAEEVFALHAGFARGRADEERVCELADSLRGVHLRTGDTMRLDPRSSLLLEKLPRPEVDDLLLEAVPDIAYSDIGGLDPQIEQIADAVELPFLYADLFAEPGWQASECRRALWQEWFAGAVWSLREVNDEIRIGHEATSRGIVASGCGHRQWPRRSQMTAPPSPPQRSSSTRARATSRSGSL